MNYLVLHNIRSLMNVGAIFRTADGAGVDKIILSGYTPGPYNKFGGDNGKIEKTSLGAHKFVKSERTKNLTKTLEDLKKEKFYIIGIEQGKNSKDYKKIKAKNKNVFILGNEVRGISKSLQEKCDVLAEIPMAGKKESLNVSVSAGIAIFRILNL